MKIIIKDSNKEKIEMELEKVQCRCLYRKVSFDNLSSIIKDIEDKLDIPKSRMLGVDADVDYNAQDFPRAYKFNPESTHIRIKKVASGWALIDVWRGKCRPSTQKYILDLPDDAIMAIVDSKRVF